MDKKFIDKKYLENHALFGGLTDEQMDKIIKYLKYKSFKEGEFILFEDKPNDKIYFIIKGQVAVLKHVVDRLNIIDEKIAILKEGDSFGEMEIIEIKNCIASVKAIEDTEVITLSNKDLIKIQHESLKIFTMIIWNLARILSRRLRKLDKAFATTVHQIHLFYTKFNKGTV